MKLWFEDDWEEEIGRLRRLGRLTQEDAQAFEAFFKAARKKTASRQPPSWKHIVMRERAECLARYKSDWLFKRETMCKVISSTKSQSGVRSMIDYIRKPREEAGECRQPVLYDGRGTPIPDEGVGTELEQWRLLTDDENLSRTARNLKCEGGAAVIEGANEKDKLGRVQGYHLAFSVNRKPEDPADTPERLVRAARDTIFEVFQSSGHPALWALHQDRPDHPHVHVVVRARSERGPRLRFDRDGDYVHYLRILFARNLDEEGLPFTATRREDRYPLRAKMLDGYAPLRDSWHIRDTKRRSSKLIHRAGETYPYLNLNALEGHSASGSLLKQHQPQAAQRPSRIRLRELMKTRAQRTWLKNIRPEWQPLGRSLMDLYEDPKQALSVIVVMSSAYKCNKAYVAWLLKRNPAIFGRLKNHDSRDPKPLANVCSVLSRQTPIGVREDQQPLPDDAASHHAVISKKSTKEINWNRAGVIRSIARVARYWRDEGGDNRLADLVMKELTDSLEQSEPIRSRMRSARPRVPIMSDSGNVQIAPKSDMSKGKSTPASEPLQGTQMDSRAMRDMARAKRRKRDRDRGM